MRHVTSSDEEFSLLLMFFFKVFRPFLLIGCLAVGICFHFSFSICCRAKAFFLGCLLRWRIFVSYCSLLFSFVVALSEMVLKSLVIYQDSLVYSHKETSQVSTAFGWK